MNFRWPQIWQVVIEWTGKGGLCCRLFGHRPYMSNPSIYECRWCSARGYWHWKGHQANCYHKYSPTRCSCDPPKPLRPQPQP